MFLGLYQADLYERADSAKAARATGSTVHFTEWIADHPNRNAIYTLCDQLTLQDYFTSCDSDTSDVSTDTTLAQDTIMADDLLLGFQRFRFKRACYSGLEFNF